MVIARTVAFERAKADFFPLLGPSARSHRATVLVFPCRL